MMSSYFASNSARARYGRLGAGLDIDQQREARPIGEQLAATGLGALLQRFEIKLFQRALRVKLQHGMRYQQPTIDQEDVGFDAGKAAVERVEQRPLVQIIVMRMGLTQRRRFGASGGIQITGAGKCRNQGDK